MKKLFYLASLPLIIFSLPLTYAQLIEEEVKVINYSEEFLSLLYKNPELIIDHVEENSLELYGPKGMKKWLDEKSVIYFDLESAPIHEEGPLGENFGRGEATEKAGIGEYKDYPLYEKWSKDLADLVKKYPKIAKMFSIGKSVEGRELWVVKISDFVNLDEVEPEFKYISSMHGNEITGRELCLLFIKDLLESYGKSQEITKLIDNTEIFIMPSMNPDGSEPYKNAQGLKLRSRRSNANGIDLNRNFPEYTRRDLNSPKKREPETQALMKFQKERNFALSANFHGGTIVVNYPWDATYTAHPLRKLVVELSLTYSRPNYEMFNSRRFKNGITNGADWYVLRGGMQDWSYAYHNDLQVTIELSHSKWPRYSEINDFYLKNKQSMLNYAQNIHQGGGVVVKSNKGFDLQAVEIFKLEKTKDLTEEFKSIGIYGIKNNEFYKVLPVGTYRFDILDNTKKLYKSEVVRVQKDFLKKNGNYISLTD